MYIQFRFAEIYGRPWFTLLRLHVAHSYPCTQVYRHKGILCLPNEGLYAMLRPRPIRLRAVPARVYITHSCCQKISNTDLNIATATASYLHLCACLSPSSIIWYRPGAG